MSPEADLHPSIATLKSRLESGEITAVQLVSDSIDAIERAEAGENGLNAFLSLRRELALAEAEAADWERTEGIELGPLAGIPVAVKDNIAVAEGPTTAGSKILQGFVPPYDAGAIARLKHAGAIVIGKTNLDEFAMGSSTENSAFGPTRNPHDRERVPGGSSGGSAAAVAAGYVPGALGSDTGGSIRQPAALCGVVGLKPTYGRVSRYGLVAFASSLDQIGPLARSTEDAAHLLSAISGHDPLDSTSAKRPVPDYAQGLQRPLRGLRVGLAREYLPAELDPRVRAAVDEAAETLRSAGAQIKEVSLPHTGEGIAAYYVVATAEASSNLARYDGVRYGVRAANAADLQEMYVRTRHEGFGQEVRRRIMLGTYVLSAGYYEAFYAKGREVRRLIARDFDRAFKEVHCLLTPTTPTPAFRFGEKTHDPLEMYLADVFTVAVNLAGVPAVSIPAPRRDPLPVGVQLIGPRWSEERLLNVGWHLEHGSDAAARSRPAIRAPQREPAEKEADELVPAARSRSGRREPAGDAGRGGRDTAREERAAPEGSPRTRRDGRQRRRGESKRSGGGRGGRTGAGARDEATKPVDESRPSATEQPEGSGGRRRGRGGRGRRGGRGGRGANE